MSDKLCEHGRWLGNKWCCLVCFQVNRRKEKEFKNSSDSTCCIFFEKEIKENDEIFRKLTQL